MQNIDRGIPGWSVVQAFPYLGCTYEAMYLPFYAGVEVMFLIRHRHQADMDSFLSDNFAW